MGVTVNGAVLGQAWRVLAAVCLCWICAGEALAQGICAEVRLRISQEAVMTRSAFKATLELANNSSTATVDNAGVERSTPLLPALVTLHPEAALELDYFQVRDVPGDDAIPDFLANDATGGVDGLPDTINSSQGGVPMPVSPYTSQGDIGRITLESGDRLFIQSPNVVQA